MKRIDEMENAELDSEINKLEERIAKVRKLQLLREQLEICELGKLTNSKADAIIRGICMIVCENFKIPIERIYGKRRFENIIIPRHTIYYMAREFELTFEEIAGAFKKHHGTIMHGVKHIENKIATEPKFEMLIISLKKQFLLATKNT